MTSHKTVRMSRRPVGVALALLGVALSSSARAQLITLHTGNGVVGGTDAFIRYLAKSGPFTSADFAAARAGAAPTIVTNHPVWMTELPSDPTAKWLALDSSRSPQSMLYAYDFQVTATTIASASLDLRYGVDNNVGSTSPSVAGLYINEVALPGTTQIGSYDHEYQYTNASLGSLLHTGTNTFYFYQYDFGGVAGSIYDAQITVNDTPEPGNLAWIVGMAFGGVGFLARRRRK